MIEIDAYYPYWLANSLVAIDTTKGNPPLSVIAKALIAARYGIEGASEAWRKAFPRAFEKMDELLTYINEMLPPDATTAQDKILTNGEMYRLRSLVLAIASTLADESKHSYVLVVEDQRCLSSYTLIENVESCFPSDAWNIINKEAKDEFEESGRCLALERYTAAGFHSLRGVECAIREYILKLTGALPLKRDWGAYIKVLTDNAANPNLTAVLDNIRTLERNPLMHPEHWLEIDDAIGIFNISHTAIVRIAAGLKNNQEKS